MQQRNNEALDKGFLVARSDGLGARLQAMLNAIVLARHFGVAFRFVWQAKTSEMHAVVSAGRTFGESFLAEHYLERYDPVDYYDLGSCAHTEERIRGHLMSSPRGVVVHHWPLTQIVQPTPWNDVGQQYVDAFRTIEFAAGVAEAMAAASSVKLPPNAVAVHLRAGDIVYGWFRFMKTYNRKVLPYPIAKRLISDLLAQGRYPVIFGQDPATCRLLAKMFDLKLASDFMRHHGTASNLEIALAEVTLMSRCECIFSGSSSFPILAGLIGNSTVIEPRDLWSDEEIVQIISTDEDLLDDNSKVPALQKAFSYFSAAHAGVKLLSVRQRLDLLEQATSHDPCNGFYWLVKAALHLSEGRVEDAEEELRQAIRYGIERNRPLNETTLFGIVSRANSAGVPFLAEYLAHVSRIAGNGRPAASFIAAMSAFATGKHEEADSLIRDSLSLGADAVSLQRLIEAARTYRA